MIPARLLEYRSDFPGLEDVTEWQLLRKWALSEVYRATMKTGCTRIIKWGGKEMAREESIYRQLLAPLGVRSAHIYGCVETEHGGLIIMEDAGLDNLEESPSPAHFVEAAKELARLRSSAAAHLQQGHVPKSIINSYSKTTRDYLRMLDELIDARPNDELMLLKTKARLPAHLERVFREVPQTLVHHDYHAKNLVIQGGRILPIDWSNAYLSCHLGDLYSLITEAHGFSGVPSEVILSAFRREIGEDSTTPERLVWEVTVGGLCWLIQSVRWLVYGGTATIPGSEAWIPELLEDMDKLASALDTGELHV